MSISTATHPTAYVYRPELTRVERALWAVGSALDALRVPVLRLGRFSA
jgi:hypothetical protein